MKQGEILKFIINVGICLKWLLKKNALKKKSSGFHWKKGKQIEEQGRLYLIHFRKI